MTVQQAREQGLCGNSFSLATAIDADSHCEPASRVVRDGRHKGTMFSWFEDRWHTTDLESGLYCGTFERLAVVTLADGADGDDGLNQVALGIDMEVPRGEWVVDAEELDSLRESYGERLEVIWEQEQR